MQYWCISTEIDSCDSGCANSITNTYYTNYEKALSDFEIKLVKRGKCGDGLMLMECEDVEGVITPKTVIKEVDMYEEVEVYEMCGRRLILVYIANGTRRTTKVYDDSTTIRAICQENGIVYEPCRTRLDGAHLRADEYDKSLAEFGITERCSLSRMTKI